ncbi:MAG TPA: Ig-like domain-containing protein [Bacillota bacterium]|nr:Ig-like domain-containing protein [Bacillota bacterium]
MGLRKIIFVSSLVFILGIGIIQTAWAGPGGKPVSITAQLEELGKKKEVEALRTENSRTYEEKDGQKTVFITAEPLNYLGNDGKYYPIDINLTSAPQPKNTKTSKSNNNKYRHQAFKNALRTSFSDDSSDGIVLEHGKERIEFAIKHQTNRKAVINKNKIRYEKVFENADLEYTILPGCLKDELIFKSVPKTPIISYKVNFGGLKHQTAKDGTIQLLNAEGKPVFDLLPSFMFEKGSQKSLKQIDTKFHWEKDGLYCDLILDMKWLKDKKRKYPIVIDPSLVSSGTDWKRFLMHSPVDGLGITCEINVNGPEWKGYFCTSYDWLYNTFRDLQGSTYIYFNETSGNYYDKQTISSIAGHDYEVIVHGGKSNQTILFWSSNSYGSASALITYQDLFSAELKSVKAPYNTTVESNTITKEITINNPQTIRFNNTPGFQILQGSSPMSLSGDSKYLPQGIYTLKLAPIESGGVVHHQNIQIDFPYLTSAYESRITMGTSPGYIDSTFKVPADSKLLLGYQVPDNELAWEGIRSYPRIKVSSETGVSLYDRSLNSNHYNTGIEGGDILELKKEVPYHLLVSRGQSSLGTAGWGHINLTVHHLQNDIAGTVSDLILVDQAGHDVDLGYARNDYGLRFKYEDREANPLKEYILQITKTGEKGAFVSREYPFTRVNLQNGQVTIPLKVGGLGFTTGDRVNCKVISAWDGFDFSRTADQGISFTIDDTAPVIGDFAVTNYETTIDLNCLAMDNAGGCGLKNRVLTWRIDGGAFNSVTLDSGVTAYSLTNLPYNAKIDASLTATDNLNNSATKTKIIYTYPNRTHLVAPGQISGTNATRYQTDLKLGKVAASFYRVERYRDRISPETRDYDTGYLDAGALTALKAGPPSVIITSPYSGSVFTRPANITITANGFDVDGTIAKVDFYSGTALIGTATSQPYTMTWNNAPLGNYAITAKATDNDGLTTQSNPVNISVINSLPAVSITNGVSGYNTTVTINATASDGDGTVSRVDFYIGSNLLSSDTASPFSYSFNWTYPADTVYTLTAQAFDNNGAVTTSAPVTINYKSACETRYRQVCHDEQQCHQHCYDDCDLQIFGWCAINPHQHCYTECELVPVCVTEPYQYCTYSFVITNGSVPPTPSPTPVVVQPTSTPDPGQDCYWIPDRPAQKHQNYIYRIYTKNGDKELYQDSGVIPVANNLPEIADIQPGNGSVSYSNGVINLVPQIIDQDDDTLRFYYSITGPDGRNSGETSAREWTFGSIQAPVLNGQYTWKVIAKDEVDGEVTATGTIIVDKSYPTASFAINNHASYTNNRLVKLSVTDVSTNVQRVEIANSQTGPWTNIGLNPSYDWSLSAGDGVKTVYLRAFNQAGVASQQIIQRSIILDTVKPNIAGINIFKQGGSGKVYFSWDGVSDNTGGSGLAAKVNLQVLENGVWGDRPGYDGASIELAAAGNNTLAALKLQFIDNAGNQSDWTSPSNGYSLAASGSIDTAHTESGYSSSTGHYLNIKLTPVPGVTKYQIECVQNPGGGYSGPVDPGTLTLQNTGLIPHGIYTYKIYTYNGANEATISEVSAGIEVGNNFIATPVGVKPAGYIRQLTGIDFGFDSDFSHADPDGDSLTVEYYLSADGSYFYKLEGAYLNGLTSGDTYWWYAKVSDGQGGVTQTDPVRFMPDTLSPVIFVDYQDIQYAPEHRVNLQASDADSGLQSFRYRLNDSAWQTPGGELVITNQGLNTLYVEATDFAGNITTYSHTYAIDRTPPTISQIQFGLADRDGKYLAGDDQIPAQWTAVDPETGVVQFKYGWGETPGGNPDSMQPLVLLDQQTTYQTILPGDFEDGKTYYLYIQGQNFLGQSGMVASSPPLLYDHTAPSVKITGLSGGVGFSGQYYLTKLSLLGVEAQANDPHTGITKTEYALVTGLTTENAVWYESLSGLKSNTAVTANTVYYLAVRVTNGTGLMAVAYSEPIFIEVTGPELTVNGAIEQTDTKQYTAAVETKDSETMVTKLQYAIGTAPGETDLSLNLPGADNGWFTVTCPAEKYEINQYANIPVGTTYYITVKSFNIAGLVTTVTSNPIRVIGPKVTAPEVNDDGYYTCEKTKLHFDWSYGASPKPIAGYDYQIRSRQGVIKGWTPYEATGSVSLLVDGLTLANNMVYYCDVKARFGDGTSSDVGTSNGILVDFSSPIIGNLKVPTYGNGNGINVTWDASDTESGVKCYLGLGTDPGTTDVTKGWLALGGLKAYQINRDISGAAIVFESGQRYYATLLAENGAGLAVEQTGGAIRIDLTPPPVPVVLDDGSYTNRADRLRANWKWTPTDPESGLKEYQYTVTNKKELTGGEYWENIGLDPEFELTGIQLIQGRTYYIAVKAVNNAGAESIGFSDGILVDITAPDPPVAVDYGDYSLSNRVLSVDLKASDAQSGIGEYKLALGTLEDPDEVFGAREIFSNGGLERLNLDNLNLAEGKVYFFTVSAVNHANLMSIETKSDGIMVDSKPPQVTAVSVPGRYQADPSRISFDWEAVTTPSGIAEAQYVISTNPNGSNLTWENLELGGSKMVTGLQLKDGATYYVFVRVQNRAQAENTPNTWSVLAHSNPLTIDLTAPEILKVVTPRAGFIGQHFLFQWEGRDTGSGIIEYRYAVGSNRGGADLTDGWVTLITSENAVSFYRDDIPLSDTNAYYISVKSKNGAGLWSEVFQTNAIIADLTPPVITKLNFGSEYLRSTSIIKGISWEANDEQTGIRAYRIKLVTAKDGKPLDVQSVMTEQTSGTIDLAGLDLTDGQTYYIAIQFQNQVLAWSPVQYSAPVVVDVTAPVVTITNPAPELVTNSGQMDIPFRISEPGTVVLKLTCPDGREEVQTVTVTDNFVYSFNQTMEGKYTLSLSPTDRAGNPGEAVTQKIRLNAKPVAIIGSNLRITKGTTVHFNPETSDSDGSVVEYSWNFGDPNSETNTSAEAKPAHTYQELGEYRVTLRVKDNDGKWSVESETTITVTNTFAGELKLDEDWEGTIVITGNIVVPQGVTLRIKAGTRIDFTSNYQIKVSGKIIVLGTPENPVIIGNEIAWNGIRLEQAVAGSIIQNTTIENASVGLVIYRSQALVEGSSFTNNGIGIHILGCAPTLRNCIFEGNTVYGVKEDDSASPTVSGCSFSNNTIDYYDDQRGIISVEANH